MDPNTLNHWEAHVCCRAPDALDTLGIQTVIVAPVAAPMLGYCRPSHNSVFKTVGACPLLSLEPSLSSSSSSLWFRPTDLSILANGEWDDTDFESSRYILMTAKSRQLINNHIRQLE